MTDLSQAADMEISELVIPIEVIEYDVEQPTLATNVIPLSKAKRKSPQATGFDYTGVSDEIAKEAKATANRIRNLLRAHIIDTGKELLNIKEKLDHGKFGAWLDFHFRMKERTAQNYMNAATAFGSAPKIIDMLPPSMIYQLAAKSTPVELRQAIIEEINRGEILDPKEVRKRIVEMKAEARLLAREENDAYSDDASRGPERPGDDELSNRNGDAIILDQSRDDRIEDPETTIISMLPEDRAKRFALFFKEKLGLKFEQFRVEILATDPIALWKALREI